METSSEQQQQQQQQQQQKQHTDTQEDSLDGNSVDRFLVGDVSEVQFYRKLAAAKNLSEFIQCIYAVVTQLGFSDFQFCRIGPVCGLVGNVLDTREDFLNIYRNEYCRHDMALQHCRAGTTPVFFSSIQRFIESAPIVTEQFQRNMEWINLNKSLGYYDFYSIPTSSQCGGDKTMFTVSAKQLSESAFRERVVKSKNILILFAEAIDYIGSARFPEFFLEKSCDEDVLLAAKPLLLLNTIVKENLTLKAAAERLCISVDTANKHIFVAKRALGAKTQASAVYFAIKEGLISCDPEEC